MSEDRALQERVLSALEFEPAVDAAEIGVTAHDGVVTLRGSVKTYFEKTRAERAAARVYGVRALANDIEVLPDYARRESDPAIAAAVAGALAGDAAIPANAVRATVRDGWITLDGHVAWKYQRDAAEDALRRLYGVRGITNAIVVKPHARASDVRAKIEEAFERSAEIDAGSIHVAETFSGQVMLTGTVRSLGERRAAEQAAWSVPGVTLVDDRLAVTP
jgi:osmotically-inducible protein OsmY